MTDLVELPGGTFRMGAEGWYPEERPVRAVTVGPFAIDPHPVTNAEFAQFVAATGYATWAERPPAAELYPDADPALLVPGSAVFRKTVGPVDLRDYRSWWAWEPGADWRHPEGPDSTIAGREDHPVVHVAHVDAAAYATWAGKALPSEAEWEYAARGGLDGATFTWGEEPPAGGPALANVWQGEFPWQNLALDGYEGTSPVGAYPPNGFGLVDMAGNVWEWTDDWFTPPGAAPVAPCCAPVDLGRPPEERFPRRVIKGGSHLCAPSYCLRYRPAARQGEAIDSTTSHIGFRCVVRR